MTTTIIETLITYKYLMNKSKHDISYMLLDILDKLEILQKENECLHREIEILETNKLESCPSCGNKKILIYSHKHDCPRRNDAGL